MAKIKGLRMKQATSFHQSSVLPGHDIGSHSIWASSVVSPPAERHVHLFAAAENSPIGDEGSRGREER